MAATTETTQKDTSADPLAAFSERTRAWFERSFAGPTPAQAAGWPVIATGANTLICAPTGSGKTLAAFLWGIDRIASEPDKLGAGVKLVYVSPRTGRAVSASAGEPYKERLLRLPAFLTGRVPAVGREDLVAGFALTGHFLAARVHDPAGTALPEVRSRMIALLTGS